MSDDAARVRKLLRQQAAIARFGTLALRETDLLGVLTEAARVCADGLSVPFCKVCQYRATEDDLLIVAGHGWRPGVVGHVVSRADDSSPQGRAFITGQPSICADLHAEGHFVLPPFYAEHGIISTIDVVIKDKDSDRPYGVLEIDSNTQQDYDQHDVDFLTSFANVLAEAVATASRTAVLQTTIENMQSLLDQKKILAAELQHRVRNNLQLVHGMLSKQLSDTQDKAGQRGLKAISRRVSALAQVYDHLLGNEMTRTTDFGSYVKSLCLNLAVIQGSPADRIALSCSSEELRLDLDVVTALGIVVTELISNSYDHAFPNGIGEIVVAVNRIGANTATITITDNGTGFIASGEDKRHGLGLVRRLVEQVRGTVTVGSTKGTAWTIRFPTGAAAPMARSDALSGGKIVPLSR